MPGTRIRRPKLAVLLAVAVLVVLAGSTGVVRGEELDTPWVEPKDPVWPHALTLGFEPMVSMPLGDWGAIAGIGVGAGARIEYRAHVLVRAAVRGGWVFHLIKGEVNTHELVGMAALEVFVGRARPEFFWIEGGVTHLRFKEGPGIPRIDNATEPSAGAGVGYDGGRFVARMGAYFPAIDQTSVGFAFMTSLTVRVVGLLEAPR